MSAPKQPNQANYTPSGACPKCGYLFDGGVCPECGEITLRNQLRPLKRSRTSRRVLLAFVLVAALWTALHVLMTYVPWRSFWPAAWLLADIRDSRNQSELFRRIEARTLSPTESLAFLEALFPGQSVRGQAHAENGQGRLRTIATVSCAAFASSASELWTIKQREHTISVNDRALNTPERVQAGSTTQPIWGIASFISERPFSDPIDEIKFPFSVEVAISFDIVAPSGAVVHTILRKSTATVVEWGVPFDSERE